jgi:SAM-dependent methyltransferase
MNPGYHDTRFDFDPRREVLWATLCECYFQKLVSPDDCVLDIGAGYGQFINNIRAKHRIAFDCWPGMLGFLKADVEGIVSPATDLSAVGDGTVDFVLASNVFEHLTREELAIVLEQIRRKLKVSGTLTILQPNYRFAYKEYFDDYTHVAIYSDRSMCDVLVANGFRIEQCQPRFLPLTIRSSFPVSPFLIRTYLRLPVKPFGKQMLIRARPEPQVGEK